MRHFKCSSVYKLYCSKCCKKFLKYLRFEKIAAIDSFVLVTWFINVIGLIQNLICTKIDAQNFPALLTCSMSCLIYVNTIIILNFCIYNCKNFLFSFQFIFNLHLFCFLYNLIISMCVRYMCSEKTSLNLSNQTRLRWDLLFQLYIFALLFSALVWNFFTL